MTETGSLTLTAALRPAALDGRRGIVRLHPAVAAALGLRPGDAVALEGRRRSAGVLAYAEPTASRAVLYADDLTLGNLALRDGGQVAVAPLPVRAARRVTVAGPVEVAAAVSPEMLRLALLGKVVTVDDNVSLLPQDVAPTDRALVDAARRSLSNTVGMAWTTVLLTVTDVDPGGSALVTMDTVVAWRDGQATHSSATPAPASGTVAATVVPDSADEHAAPPLSVEDLAGQRHQAEKLRELLDLGFHHTEVLRKLSTEISLGVLVTGPAGSGKSTMVRAVAHEVDAETVTVWAPEVAALVADDAAAHLRKAAAAARAHRAAVLLVSDVEALASREQPSGLGTVFRRIVEDTLRAGVAVVCTTSHPEQVDTQLRHPGLLEHEIAVPLPDVTSRRDLLAVLSRGVPLAEDVRLDDVAARTPGFVAADLLTLVREAGVRAAMRHRPRGDADAGAAEQPQVTREDFEAALEAVRPTSMAESTLELAKVTLDDVGDMAAVKEVLTEVVLWPLTYPDTFDRLGIAPPRGVLLYGPPGCGKTFLVKAIAGTGKANVLSVKGAELLSKWVGESERAVRELFRRAREAAPTLVFLDEIDALAPVRGQATDGGTTDRVVASLLTELDGVESLRNVVVVGATNRPDLVDPALLRPGRLERLVYVPPPDGQARKEILAAAAREVPMADGVDLASLADDLDGFSAADCAALVREAALAAMRESLDAAEVTAAHVAQARDRVRPSLDPVQVAHLAAYADSR